MRLAEMPAATVANMKYDHHIGFDGKQHPVLMRLSTIEKLAYFERKFRILRREWAAFGKLGKRSYCLLQSLEPPQAGRAGLLLQQPFKDDV